MNFQKICLIIIAKQTAKNNYEKAKLDAKLMRSINKAKLKALRNMPKRDGKFDYPNNELSFLNSIEVREDNVRIFDGEKKTYDTYYYNDEENRNIGEDRDVDKDVDRQGNRKKKGKKEEEMLIH